MDINSYISNFLSNNTDMNKYSVENSNLNNFDIQDEDFPKNIFFFNDGANTDSYCDLFDLESNQQKNDESFLNFKLPDNDNPHNEITHDDIFFKLLPYDYD